MLMLVFRGLEVSRSEPEQPIDLVPLTSLPAQSDLADMLRIAHLNPTRSVCLRWKIDQHPGEYLLEAIFLSKSDICPEWNLYRIADPESLTEHHHSSSPQQDSSDNDVTHIWTQTTDNLHTLFQFLNVEAQREAPFTMSAGESTPDDNAPTALPPSAPDSSLPQQGSITVKTGNNAPHSVPLAQGLKRTLPRLPSMEPPTQSPSAVSGQSDQAAALTKEEQSITGGLAAVNPGAEYTPIPATKAEVSAAALKRFTASDLIVIDENALAKGVVLAGDLVEIELQGVLQSIRICKMSGRLDIQDGTNHCELYFEEGELVHAALHSALATDVDMDKDLVGDQIVLDVLTWDRGAFYFNPGRSTFERSITKRLETLLLEGASLRDFSRYLSSLGVTTDSIIEYKQCLSDSALEEKLKNGVPIDFARQQKLYSTIDGKTPLGLMLKRMGMPRSTWMPIMFNLFNYDLVTIVGAPRIKSLTGLPTVPTIEQSIVKEAAKHLVRPETGLFSYALFLHFLQREYARYVRCKSGFSIAILEIRNKGETLSDLALHAVAKCFESLKEHFDILGHYRISEMIMLLPLRDDRDSRKFVESFIEQLAHADLDGVEAYSDLRISCGIAALPGGNDQLSSLLRDAESAKQEAIGNNNLITSSREVRWQFLSRSAEIALNARDYVEAEILLSAAFAESEQFPTDDLRVISTIDRLCEVLDIEGKYAMAEPMISLKIVHKTRSLGPNHSEVLLACRELVRCYCQQNKYHDAELLLRDTIGRIKQSSACDHLDLANALYSLASVYQAEQKFEDAETACNEALEVLKQALGPDHPETVKLAKTQTDLAKLLKPGSLSAKRVEERNGAASSNSGAGQLNEAPRGPQSTP